MPPNKTTSAGHEYGPTVNGKMYLSLSYHRGKGSKADKHTWCIPPDTEYGIFHNSDKHNLHDGNRNYWGVLETGKATLGTNGERLSIFPCTSNDQDPWHGYPVSPLEERKRNPLPPDFDLLVEKWIKEKVIDKAVGRKIQKLKL